MNAVCVGLELIAGLPYWHLVFRSYHRTASYAYRIPNGHMVRIGKDLDKQNLGFLK